MGTQTEPTTQSHDLQQALEAAVAARKRIPSEEEATDEDPKYIEAQLAYDDCTRQLALAIIAHINDHEDEIEWADGAKIELLAEQVIKLTTEDLD